MTVEKGIEQDDIVPAKKLYGGAEDLLLQCQAKQSNQGGSTRLAALCLVVLVRGLAIHVLSSSFRAMEVDLNLQPSSLGTLALFQGIATAASGPVWGNFVDAGASRSLLLTIAIGTWAFCAIAISCLQSFVMIAGLYLLNGAAMGCLHPVIYPMVIDLCGEQDHGKMFGCMAFCAFGGQVLCCLLVTPLSGSQVGPVAGWRAALFSIGLVSILLVTVVSNHLRDPLRYWRPERLGILPELKKVGEFLQIRTFFVFLLQGMFGSIPGSALAFATLYLQYTGAHSSMVAAMLSFHMLGHASGCMFGGFVGDALHKLSPNYGRAFTAQLSYALAIPCCIVSFGLITPTEDNIILIGCMLAVFGFVGSWVPTGCIVPMMCDIVQRRSLSSAYAWETAFCSASGAIFGPVTVGYVAEHFFNYKPTDELVSQMLPDQRLSNAEAIGASLTIVCAVPYFISFLFLTLLFFTYPNDARRSQEVESADKVPHENSGLLRPQGVRH